jgi:hypothetical protein
MKQFYITKENISQDSPDDCALPPDDPIHELKIASYLGGLGAQARLAEYNVETAKRNMVNNANNEKAKYMKEFGVKPGTPAWFELWFGKGLK